MPDLHIAGIDKIPSELSLAAEHRITGGHVSIGLNESAAGMFRASHSMDSAPGLAP
jgi:hypothetical protein